MNAVSNPMAEEPRYNVIRDEVVPLLKDISDDLSNLMSAHTQAMQARQKEQQNNDILIALKVNFENIDRKFDAFMASHQVFETNQRSIQQSFEERQRDLELKITKIMSIGGAALTLITIVVHLLGK